mgnify:CR=1 FL=1
MVPWGFDVAGRYDHAGREVAMTPIRFGRHVDTIDSGSTARKLAILHKRRGAVIPLVAILLGVILATVAFAIDVGYIALADTEFQRTADACAIAAVQRLPEKGNAIAAARWVAQQNRGSSDP